MPRQFGVVSIVSGGTTALTGIIANNVTSGATVHHHQIEVAYT